MTAYTTTEKSRRGRRDVYEESTTAVLAALGRGTIPWRRPWSAEQGIPPRSVKTGKPYRGVNFFQLAMAGYESPWWLTFKHAKDRGAKVRKGEHGQTVVMWKRHRRRLDDAQVAEARANGQRVERDEQGAAYVEQVFARAYVVFNAEQVDGLDDGSEPQTPREPDWQPEARAAAIAAGYDGPSVAEGGSRALYQPQRDHVQMPDRGRFATATDWHATLFHELGHSTGHRDRLNRLDLYEGRFGSPEYAREELTAEMAAALLCAVAGIDSAPLTDQHAAYIDSWRRAISTDQRLVTTAAQRAQRAADLILGTFQDSEDTHEAPAPMA